MKRLIYYSTGKIFHQYAMQTDWDMVIAVADKNTSDEKVMMDKPFITPDKISDYSFDYIVVFSDKYYNEIRLNLIGQYEIDPFQILPYHAIIVDKRDKYKLWREYLEFCKKLLISEKLNEVFDRNGLLIKYGVYNKQDFASESCNVYYTGKIEYPIFFNVYKGKYKDDSKEKYKFVLMDAEKSISAVIAEISFLNKCADKIFFFTPYFQDEVFMMDRLMHQKNIIGIYVHYGILWLIEKPHEISEKEEIHIYVVSHKKYTTFNDGIYRKICVGGYQEENCLRDCVGENITYLNDKLNEVTAMYWIWKNTKEKYIGMCHYRRFFCRDIIANYDLVLSEKQAYIYLKSYDILVGEITDVSQTVYSHLKMTISSSAFENAYAIIRAKIQEHQPSYVNAFDCVMEGQYYFTKNMFIMSRKNFHSYCSWLFSFLIEAAEAFDASLYDSYSKRAIGFFAETMLTVWLMKQDLKIKQLPVITLDSITNSLENGTIA